MAKFCELIPHLSRSARDEGWSPTLDDVVARVRDDGNPGQALLDFWRTLGDLGDARGPSNLVGQRPTPPPPGGYTCPRGRCDRVERRAPGGPLPECALFDEPLRFGR
ncbi:MAG: hypothetical protein HOV94_10510 [Saccharothrix sp.]|nr:hypothetical protein [Saccharothrix sp.]